MLVSLRTALTKQTDGLQLKITLDNTTLDKIKLVVDGFATLALLSFGVSAWNALSDQVPSVLVRPLWTMATWDLTFF